MYNINPKLPKTTNTAKAPQNQIKKLNVPLPAGNIHKYRAITIIDSKGPFCENSNTVIGCSISRLGRVTEDGVRAPVTGGKF